jgi:glycosyltransferase involved in cell wall biosynthesis
MPPLHDGPVTGKEIKVEVGGGEAPMCQDAVQVDLRPLRGVDIVADVKSLPFRSEIAAHVYSSHMLEHLSYRDGWVFLKECHRIMKKKARLEVSCPDLTAVARIYLVSNLQHRIGRLDKVASAFYGSQGHSADFHLSGYDYASLSRILVDIGFDNIRRLRSAENVKDPRVRRARRLYELRTEAFKPVRRRPRARVQPEERSLDWKDEKQYLKSEIKLANSAIQRLERRHPDPLSTLLHLYVTREDLRKAFPEVRNGDYLRLLQWANDTVNNRTDRDYIRLARYAKWYALDPWHQLVQAKSEISGLHVALSKSEGQSSQLRSETTLLHDQLANSEKEKTQLRSDIHSLGEERKILEGRVQALTHSWSWRLSAPLRWGGPLLSASRNRKRPSEIVQGESTIVSGFPENLVACTIVAKNYLSQARVLTDSFLKYHPTSMVFVLLVDEVDDYFDPGAERFRLVRFEELGIEKPDAFRFKYKVIELSTAVKPFFLEYLFRKFGLRKIVYLDPDILVTDTLHELSELLDHHDIVLTPHILEPMDDDRRPSELDILLAGTYNLGFIAISSTENTASFLKWWQRRVYDYCIMDPLKGFHVDQKWVELALGFFDGIYILRDPGYNVAYWNMGTRRLTVSNGKYFANDRPLRFYHFSGLDPDDLNRISRHQNRYTLKDLPDHAGLFETYRDLLYSAGHKTVRHWPCTCDYFDNGVKIPEEARKTYRESTELQRKYPNPFATRTGKTYFDWLNTSAELVPTSPPITRLWLEIYGIRKDVREAYPDLFGSNRLGFTSWAINTGWKEHGIDKAFLPEEYFALSELSEQRKSADTVGLKNARASNELAAITKRSLEVIREEGVSSFLLQTAVKIRRREFRIIRPPFDLAEAHIFRPPDIELDSRIDSANPAERPSSATVEKQNALPFGVNLAGYFTGVFGNATSSRALAEALKLADVPHVLNKEVGDVQGERHHFAASYSTSNPYAVNIVHLNADMAEAFFSSRGPRYSQDRYNIGIWYWELSKFPARWLSAFRFYDEIWATSSFVAESLSQLSPIPIVKMKHPIFIDDSMIDAQARRKFNLPEDSYIFLFTFDFLSVFERKNPLSLIKAFEQASGRNEKALLVLHHINSEANRAAAELLENESSNLNVRIMKEHLSEQDYLSLLAACDCYVSLHRSEGLGLTMAEAMYLGKPVIATAYSGNMDFMNVNNSLLVKYDLVELDSNFGPYEKGNVWAEPDVEDAAQLMRWVYDNRERAAGIGEMAKKDIRELMDPMIASQEIRTRLERIYSERSFWRRH